MTEELQIGPHERLRVITSSAELYEVEAHFGPHGSPPPTHFVASRHRDTYRLVLHGSALLGTGAVTVLGGLGRLLGRDPRR